MARASYTSKRRDDSVWGRPGAGSKGGEGQLSLGDVAPRVGWGGRRAGAGRKRGVRPNVPHRPRELHRRYQPVHVTLRRAKGVPSFRTERLTRLFRDAVRATSRARRGTFRVTDFSIQADHIHAIIEADERGGGDGDAAPDAGFSRSMRSFVIRLAMRVNKLLRRKRGHVWGDRFHARELTSPVEVRRALVYLLSNHLKHGIADVGLIDPFSSGFWFEGWMQVLARPPAPCPLEPPRTWLLDWGWHRGRDFIHLGEVARAARAPLSGR